MSNDFRLLRYGGREDFGMDWTAWLAEATISSSSWAIYPTSGGPALSGAEFSSPDTKILVAATSAHFGQVYQLVNTITDSDGETGVRAITLRVSSP